MFNLINKTLYFRILVDIEDCNSSYITNIIPTPNSQHENMYLFFFNLDGHRDRKFIGDLRWWSTNTECLKWIKYEMGLFDKKNKNHKSYDNDIIFYSITNKFELFNKLKFIKKFLLHKDFKKDTLSIKVFNKEKLKQFEDKNGIIKK